MFFLGPFHSSFRVHGFSHRLLPSRRAPSAGRLRRLCLERLESRVLPSFLAPLAYDVGPDPRSIAVGDFTGNGTRDLAVADFRHGAVASGPSGVSVLLGNGDGTFQAASGTYPAGDDPEAVAVGDFRGNGIRDLAVADNALFSGRSGVSVLLGNGDGTFAAASFFAAGPHPRSLAVGDFRGTGILDLAVANEGTGPDYRDSSVSVFFGNGDGTFEPPGPDPTSLAVAGLTGNGTLDLVVTNLRGSTVSVLMGNGDGTFRDAGRFPAGTNPLSVAVFHSNGIANLAVTNWNPGTGTVSILLGNGDGSFQAPISYPAGESSFHRGGGRLQSRR